MAAFHTRTSLHSRLEKRRNEPKFYECRITQKQLRIRPKPRKEAERAEYSRMLSNMDIRSIVCEMEQSVREIQTLLQSVHQQNGIKNIPSLCVKSREQFTKIRKQVCKLAGKVPANQYCRFHDHWRFVSQRLTGLAAFVVYLESETLITREDSAVMIGVKVNREDGFHIDLDDYLMGLLQLASELSRLAVNSVTAGDYSRPVRIAKFVAELDAGFRLLNLKNDNLRKRFDGLKYDLKKAEEVVYDLTIRGLVPKEEQKDEKSTEPDSASTS